MRIFFSFLLLIAVLLPSCSSVKKQRTKKAKVTIETRLQDLTDQIILSLNKEQSSKIAVIEFSNLQGRTTHLGRYVAEELITRLFRSGEFEVIERQLLNRVLQEQELSLTGILDEASVVKLGKLLGVQAIATGTITDLGKTVKINARLISTLTGKVFAVAAVMLPKDETIRRLMATVANDKRNGSNPNYTTEQVVLSNPFRVEFISAIRQGRKVICRLQIKNISEDDATFSVIYGHQYKTQLFDDTGAESRISLVKFANRVHKMKGLSKYESVKKKIVAGLSVPMELHFDKVPSAAKKIALLQILGVHNTHLEFRNLPITDAH